MNVKAVGVFILRQEKNWHALIHVMINIVKFLLKCRAQNYHQKKVTDGLNVNQLIPHAHDRDESQSQIKSKPFLFQYHSLETGSWSFFLTGSMRVRLEWSGRSTHLVPLLDFEQSSWRQFHINSNTIITVVNSARMDNESRIMTCLLTSGQSVFCRICLEIPGTKKISFPH